ncbi:MAG: LysR family transcriptional regulator [Clostridiales bacterium]|nr:LysR family transcriptional regulator [Clostridiales bacterium]
MNFQNIEYFLAVVKYNNFTKAAQSLYISQQSLSENIRRLEEEIGTPLLNRGRTLSLTPAGECFVSGGRKILSTQDKMLREISIVSNTVRSKIVLGVEPFDMPPFLPEALGNFTQKYPEYEISVNPPYSREKADLTFHCGAAEKGMETIPLINKDPFSVVFSRVLGEHIFGAEWAEKEKTLIETQSLEGMEKLPFLLLYTDKHLHPSAEELFQNVGFTPIEAFKSEDASLLAALCTSGTGAFLGPADYCKRKFGTLLDGSAGTLTCYPLKDIDGIDFSLTYPKGKHLNQAEKRFVEELRSLITG